MSKVTNNRENYRSRSKNICKGDQVKKNDLDTPVVKSESEAQESRLNFKVDNNGYFLWPSPKKLKEK